MYDDEDDTFGRERYLGVDVSGANVGIVRKRRASEIAARTRDYNRTWTSRTTMRDGEGKEGK